MALEAKDVDVLLKSPTPEARCAVASKIATAFTDQTLSTTETELAISIFRILARDVAESVRKTLAYKIKESDKVPHDIAFRLANDVINVAEPILRYSLVLTDSDLLSIITKSTEQARAAIASRQNIAMPVCDALVARKEELVIKTLLDNETSNLSQSAYDIILDEFSDNERIHLSLVDRPQLPTNVSEKLVHVLSEELKLRLYSNKKISKKVADELIKDTTETVVVSLIDNTKVQAKKQEDSQALVNQLATNGRLTGSIISKAIQSGNHHFFEFAVEKKTGLTIDNIRKILRDGTPEQIDALYKKSGLPASDLLSVKYHLGLIYKKPKAARPEQRPKSEIDNWFAN